MRGSDRDARANATAREQGEGSRVIRRLISLAAAVALATAIGCKGVPDKPQSQWRYLEHELEAFPRCQSSLHWRPLYDAAERRFRLG